MTTKKYPYEGNPKAIITKTILAKGGTNFNLTIIYGTLDNPPALQKILFPKRTGTLTKPYQSETEVIQALKDSLDNDKKTYGVDDLNYDITTAINIITETRATSKEERALKNRLEKSLG